MRKRLTEKNLSERSAGRTLLAFSLAASLAAFGCTTNRTPGNGEPIRSGPGVGPAAPTSGVTGSSTGSTGTSYRPMMSSSTYGEALPTVSARSKKLPLSANEAAAIMADNILGRGVRVLGPVNPGPGHAYANQVAQQPALPGYTLTPIVTVNSSVNSVAHEPAIIDGSVAVGALSAGVTAASTVSGTTATTAATTGTTATAGTGAALTPTTAATTATPGSVSGTVLTPTTAALPVTAGAFASGPGTSGVVSGAAVDNTGTLTPTVSSSQVPSVTSGSSGILGGGTVATTATNGAAVPTGATAASTNGTAVATGTTTASTTTGTTARTAAATSTRTGATASASVANPVRVFQDASGRVTVANGKSSTTTTRTTSSSKSNQ